MRIQPVPLLATALLSLPLLHPSAPAQAGAGLMVGFEPTGKTTVVRLITPSPYSAVPVTALPAKLSALTRYPSLLLFSATGGWDDGGNLYHVLPNGTFFLAGPTGYGAIPALTWDAGGPTLWGVTGGFLTSSLVVLDPPTGAATAVGPTGVIGIEALAARPGTDVLYAVTGYHYDGTPGDVLTLDRATGAATDTGLDLLDAFGDPPPSTVSGLAFSLDGSTGYATIGGGNWGEGAGTLFAFDPATFVLTELGRGSGGVSMSGVTTIF